MTDRQPPQNGWQKGRKGPDRRQRPKQLNVRVTEAEAKALANMAAARGLSTGALLRDTLFGLPSPKRRRRPRIDDVLLSRALGELAGVKAELGKSGSNLNQIAHYLNADRSLQSLAGMLEAALFEHEEAMRTLLELRAAILQAMDVGGRTGSDTD